MRDTTDRWWKETSAEILSEEDKIARLDRFLGANGASLYGKPQTEQNIILENQPFTIPQYYDTELPDVRIIPMWAGRDIAWSVAEK